uniref:E3 ubiquitin-protein ligase n=1 Tax=Heterorhabditis bacteriophora TaxID=37862 RepID=A0A1I7WS85_HETBA
MLQPYYGKFAEHERSRSVDATVLVLKVYLDHAQDISIGHASDFGPLSSLLARLTPRLADSLALVRELSLTAIHLALRLANAHKVGSFQTVLIQFEGHGSSTDAGLFKIEVFSKEYLSTEGRLDGQEAKKAIRKMAEADTLVSAILSRLAEVHQCVQTYTDLLSALVAFAVHQQQIVCDVLLRQPLPYTIHICDAWECISRERTLFACVLDYLMELMISSLEQPYDVVETGGGNSVKVVHAELCQYSAAIAEVIKNGEPEWSLNERVPALFATLFHMICSVADTQFPVIQKENKDG